MSTNHGLPIVVPSTSGTFKVGKDTPYAAVVLAAAISPTATPVAGAKSATKFRTFLAKKGVDLMFTSTFAVKNVISDIDVDINAWSPPIAGLAKFLEISLTASEMNITEIKVLKMSSVNLVKYSTTFDNEKKEDMKRKNEDHSPVQAYTGRKGTFILPQAS
jgi:hypothetical protein